MENIKFDPKLTSQELAGIQDALNYLNDDHAAIVKEWLETETKEELIQRFACEIGGHEAGDRTFLAQEHWDSYIRNHPLVIMDERAYRLASIVSALMTEVYQITMCKHWKEELEKDKSKNENS